MKALVVAAFLLTIPNLMAQETRGQILGRVHDQSGAVLVGATVAVVNTATNVKTTSITNETGDYTIPFLNPGTYTVTAQHTGFKQFERSAIALQVGSRVVIDIAMEIGDNTQRVQVTAEAPLLDAATASMGQVIDNQRLALLPLKDGNPIMLANLSPGVMNLSTGGWSRPFDVGSPSNIAVDGTRTGSNDFSLDGAPNTQRSAVAYIPPSDVVQEFKIQSASFDASAGYSPGGVINVSLKSGTNDVHGTAYEFVQNPVFNANKFFANKAGLPKAVIRLNRWGTTGSGPVYVPGLYNGKNRTFWMYGYEGIHDADPRGTITTAVPLAAQRTGDFSQLLAIGSQYQIYDPATIQPAPNGRFSRQPFPGNIIPSSRLNPTATKIAGFWSAPNQAGTIDGANNWTTPGPEWDHFYTHLFRVDHNVSERHRFFVRGEMNNREMVYDRRFNDANGAGFWRKNRGLALDDVVVFTPQFLMNARYSYTRFIEAATPLSQRMDLAGDLGFSQTFVNQIKGIDPRGIKFPRMNVAGYGELGSTTTTTARYDDAHAAALNFTRMLRSHNLRFGSEFRVYRENNYDFGQSSGDLAFSTNWTRGPLDSSPGAPMGQSLASFLLGLPTSGSVAVTSSWAEQSRDLALFLQDDWKLSPKLTLNLGLRWELELPTTERFNRSISTFDASAALPIAAAAQTNYAKSPISEVPASAFRVAGGLTFAGVNGAPRGLWQTDRNNFMPRVGLAYQVDGKTVVRSGYGVFFDQLGITRANVNQAGFSRSTSYIGTIDNGQHFITNLTNPFPGGFDLPTGSSLGAMTNVGQGITFLPRTLVSPYMQRWQASVQRQLWRQGVIEVGYVGNRGTKQKTSRNLDTVPRQYYSTSPVRDQATIDYLSAAVSNPFYPLLPNTSLSGTTVGRSQLLRPYPQFTGISYNSNQGYSWYHALQTRFEKRFAKGYTVNVAWTWSKLMEGTGYLNDTDPLPERVISDQDRTHRIVISGIYELPFGKGRLLAPNARGLLDKLIAGWQIQTIYQGQGGAALGFGNAIFNGDLHKVPLPNGQRTVQRWFNIDAGFERSSKNQLGSNIRTMPTRFSGIRGDGINNWDISFVKGTQLMERLQLQFRSEFINAFNHAQFAAPDTNPTSSGFGMVTAESQWPRTIQFGMKLVF